MQAYLGVINFSEYFGYILNRLSSILLVCSTSIQHFLVASRSKLKNMADSFVGRFVQIETIADEIFEGYVKSIDQKRKMLVLQKGIC